MKKDKTINKKVFKKSCGCCAICRVDTYELLDVHRWKVEGKDGGKYKKSNSISLCSNCHRLVHADIITIDGIFESTAGPVVIYHDENGKEQIKTIR